MKNAFVLLFILALTVAGMIVFWLGKDRSPREQQSEPQISTTSEVKGVQAISFEGEEFSFSYIKVEDASRIKLLPNFSEQKTSERVMEEGRCKNIVSGGFYSENFSPIGLFISEREVKSARQANATFDGLFLVSEGEMAQISRDIRDEEYRIALQSGPILIMDSTPLKLKLKSEELEKDRRIAIAHNVKGDIFFIVIFRGQSVFTGPTLATLPQVLEEIKNSLGENFDSAINLDGGTASAFWGEGVTLKELSPIGSYFCIN